MYLLVLGSFHTGYLVPVTDAPFVCLAIHMQPLVGCDWLLASSLHVMHSACILGIKP